MRSLIRLFAASVIALTPIAYDAMAKPNLSGLSAEQVASLNAVNAYFNGIKTIEGKFMQTAPDGSQSEGYFIIDRPGKMRFRYAPPVKMDIIADGKTVAIDDKTAQEQTLVLLSETPLRFLLDEHVDLTQEAVVNSVSMDADFITVLLEDPGNFASSKLTLIFDARTVELKQYTITDDQGQDTTVQLYETKVGSPTNPKWFEINYSKYK